MNQVRRIKDTNVIFQSHRYGANAHRFEARFVLTVIQCTHTSYYMKILIGWGWLNVDNAIFWSVVFIFFFPPYLGGSCTTRERTHGIGISWGSFFPSALEDQDYTLINGMKGRDKNTRVETGICNPVWNGGLYFKHGVWIVLTDVLINRKYCQIFENYIMKYSNFRWPYYVLLQQNSSARPARFSVRNHVYFQSI